MRLQINFAGVSEEVEVDAELTTVERHQLVAALAQNVEAEVRFILEEREDWIGPNDRVETYKFSGICRCSINNPVEHATHTPDTCPLHG